jgi:hypothetical protein
MRLRFVHVVFLTALACAPTANPNTGVQRDSNVITHAEIANAHESTAYDVVARLRPLFLRTRGRSTINGVANDYATVFVDGQRYGDLNTLKGIVANQVLEIRYLGSGEAVGKYGMQYGSGVIDVRTR